MIVTTEYLTSKGYGHVLGHITDADTEAFRSIVSRLPDHFEMVELGSFVGASAITFALLAKDLNKTCNILCIDQFRNYQEFLINTKDFNNIFHDKTYFTPSYEFNRNIDLYFDDASHVETLTYNQLIYWKKYTKHICVHDHNEHWPGVIKSVSRFAAKNNVSVETFSQSSLIHMNIENTA